MHRRVNLKAVLGNYPHTAALKAGELNSSAFGIQFHEFDPVWGGFKAMVRQQAFDVSELAVVTYLMALDRRAPLRLLPAVMLARLQHPYALMAAARPIVPSDLSGRRIGVRSISTTTGVWLRGILEDEYGFDPNSAEWFTTEESHVEVTDDFSTRLPEGTLLTDLLLNGELDAVLGEASTDPRLCKLFPDQAVEHAWFQRSGFIPINHMVVVRTNGPTGSQEVGDEVYDLLRRSRRRAGGTISKLVPFGVDATRPALEAASQYAHRLGLISRRISVEEMYSMR
jgi:4,5-dihydroxyphthalate decarboxylase